MFEKKISKLIALFSMIIIALASNIVAKDAEIKIKPQAYRAEIWRCMKRGIAVSFYDYMNNKLGIFGGHEKSIVDFFSKEDVEYYSKTIDLTTLTVVIDNYTYRGFLFPEPSVVKRVLPINEQGEMHFDNKTAYRARLIY